MLQHIFGRLKNFQIITIPKEQLIKEVRRIKIILKIEIVGTTRRSDLLKTVKCIERVFSRSKNVEVQILSHVYIASGIPKEKIGCTARIESGYQKERTTKKEIAVSIIASIIGSLLVLKLSGLL